jgi:acyl-CoA thioesterase-1
MNPILQQFGNGNVFFVAVAMGVVSFGVSPLAKGIPAAVVRILCAVSVILVALSATPLSLWKYLVWIVSLLSLFVLRWRSPQRFTRVRWVAYSLFAAISVLVAVDELRYHIRPTIIIEPSNRVFVVGDSLSAGVGDESCCWPEELEGSLGISVINLAEQGATVRTALLQGRRISDNAELVILEIGGNDLLGTTSTEEFHAALDELLDLVHGRSKTVAMFELPLPPLKNGFGRSQRDLSRKYGTILIPKRYLADVLAAEGATIDGLHLSGKGHAIMARTVGSLLTRG